MTDYKVTRIDIEQPAFSLESKRFIIISERNNMSSVISWNYKVETFVIGEMKWSVRVVYAGDQ